MSKRGHISLETYLASALLALGLVPYDDAKAMGRTNFLSLFNLDHNILHSSEHPDRDEFWNLTPMLIPAHRKKTATIDVKVAAKSKRLRAARSALNTFLTTGVKPPRPTNKRRIPSRPFSKGHRPLRSRSSFERRAP